MGGGKIMYKVVIIYIILINFFELYLMHADKQKAKKGLWRIPEKTLLLISILGGSLGGILGMYIFRHKTKHWKFVVGMPLILVLQITVIIWILHDMI